MNEIFQTDYIKEKLDSLYKRVFRKKQDTQDEGENWYKVMQIILTHLGVHLNPTGKNPKDLDAFCKSNRIRKRKITLIGQWWEKDHGPLLAFMKNKKQPTVLLFNTDGQYEIIDPDTKTKLLVNHTTASLILNEAFMFYLTFPKKIKLVKGILSLLFKVNIKLFSMLGIIGLCSVIVGLMFPISNKLLFDYIVPNYEWSGYFQVLLGILVALGSGFIFSLMRSFFIIRLNAILTNRMQMALWDRLLCLPIHFFRSIKKGDLLQRTFIFDNFRKILSNETIKVLINGIFSFVYLIAMFVFSTKLALIGTVIVVIYSAIICPFLLVKIRYERNLLASDARMQSFLVQMIRAISKIRINGSEKRMYQKWTDEFTYNRSQQFKIRTLLNFLSAFGAGMQIFLTFAIFTTFTFWTDISLQVGSFLAFSAAFGPFSQSIFSFMDTFAEMVRAIPFWERLKPILTTPIETFEDKISIERIHGAIEIKDLSFRYNQYSSNILNGIQLQIKAKQFIGLIGPSGCGKSTLCRLIFGFETPQKGAILFDGLDGKNLDLMSLRKKMMFVSQESSIFSGSIYDNITCGQTYKASEIENVIFLSTLDQELKHLPMGLNTLLSSTSGLLSGGQKQKIFLARCLIKQPKILILDETLNSLDNQTRNIIIDNLLTMKMTTILATHHLTSLQKADTIFMIKDGKIEISGPMNELMQQDLFKKYYQQQITT